MLQTYTRLMVLLETLATRWERQRGQGMVEYGLILVLVSIVVIAALLLLGNQLKSVFDSVANTIQSN